MQQRVQTVRFNAGQDGQHLYQVMVDMSIIALMCLSVSLEEMVKNIQIG